MKRSPSESWYLTRNSLLLKGRYTIEIGPSNHGRSFHGDWSNWGFWTGLKEQSRCPQPALSLSRTSKYVSAAATTEALFTYLIQEAASKILKGMGSQSNQINRIYPMSMFSTEVCKILNLHALTDNDLHLILKYLARDKSGIIYDTEVSWPSWKNVQF